ncbi:MAG: CusA/CzcA family heavy metal efflux RND transporter [Deltaproteobacteria bacterium CG_4_9_14_3_um_filter_63_12]|nr:MAG: CusA/CzcA family heavy metal efflux RND transporter [Deltaproteobacteria bacterium CG_4_9_14_3_um_filter_63_12]
MLNAVIDLALRYRSVVFLAAAILLVAGLVSFSHLPFDAYPDTTPVQVSINTVAPALAPLEVERQLTSPIEQAVSGLPKLAEVRSISKFGFSQITAIFEDGTDVYRARQVVGERVQTVELPEGIGRPSLSPMSTGLGEVFQYLVESDELSAQELRTLHHWVIRPQMLQVPGVAEINSWGGYEKQYHVLFDPDLLVKYGLRLDDVATALRRNNANVVGGVLNRGGEAQIVQGVGLATCVRDLEDIVIAAQDGAAIRIADVAHVEEGHEIRRGAVTAEGRGEAVLGLGFMLMGENSRELTRRLEERLEEVQASLPKGVRLTPVYSRTKLVDSVLRTVRDNLLEGALLVVAILFIFLGNLRAGLIVALAIPLSMLFAFNAMLQFGITGSLMSLGAIDFGLIVDSSVIMVENAARRVAEDTTGRSVRNVVRDAAVEVRKPTLFGELIIAIVYLPILALEGVEGKLFQPMALTVIFALAGSMLLSLTLMPALASLVLRRRAGAHRDNLLVRALHRAYRPVLKGALSSRVLVLGLAVLVVGDAVFLASRLGTEFVPRLREQAVVINTVRMASVSLQESVRYGTQVEHLLLDEFPDEIAHIWTRTGTAEVATDPMGLEVSDVFITLTPREEWTRADHQDVLMQAMSDALEGMPGMRSVFTQPIEMRMNEMIAGIRSDVGIKLFGDDFEVLRERAEAIREAVTEVQGAADVTVEQVTGLPILRIEVDREAVAHFGIPVQDVLELVESLGTRRVGEVVEEQMRFALVLTLDDRFRNDPLRLERLLVTAPDGQRVPLGKLAHINVVEEPSTINREWARRRIAIQVNIRDRDVGSFVADLKAAIAKVELAPGYYVRYGGQFEHLERAQKRLMIVVPIALLLVFTLLYLTFGRARDALLVFTGVPFAAVGGIAALWWLEMPFSISAGVGFIAVSGVSVLGQLVLVSRARQLLAAGRALAEATREAAETRLRPVLMTGLVAATGFVPMAFNTGVGAEVQRPLAVVVIGGVITSMIATLIVLPVLYSAFGPKNLGESEEVETGDVA